MVFEQFSNCPPQFETQTRTLFTRQFLNFAARQLQHTLFPRSRRIAQHTEALAGRMLHERAPLCLSGFQSLEDHLDRHAPARPQARQSPRGPPSFGQLVFVSLEPSRSPNTSPTGSPCRERPFSRETPGWTWLQLARHQLEGRGATGPFFLGRRSFSFVRGGSAAVGQLCGDGK